MRNNREMSAPTFNRVIKYNLNENCPINNNSGFNNISNGFNLKRIREALKKKTTFFVMNVTNGGLETHSIRHKKITTSQNPFLAI